MTGRIFAKLVVAVLAILIVALAVVDLLASRVAERTYMDTLSRDLTEKCQMLSLALDHGMSVHDDDVLRQIARSIHGRVTLIATDGRVIFDSEAHPERMENHRNRPEVRAALEGRIGSIIRPSPTLGVPFLYIGVPVSAGVARLAAPVSAIRAEVDRTRWKMLGSVALAFLPAVMLAAMFARNVSRKLGAIIEYAGKLAAGNFRARLERPGNDELGMLGQKLNDTGEKLEQTVEQWRLEHVALEKIERARKDFVINVSHELRTPLASIQGYSETLLDGALYDPENNVRFVTIIRQNAERLARLTGDLLTLSRIELKTVRFRFASYYLNALLRESIDIVRPIAEKKDIRLELEEAPGKAEVFCDSEAVHQMLSNLLDNAVKYTPASGIVVVGARACPASGGPEMMEIYVRDTGMGIPEEELPRIFERFYRVDKARSRALGGTGLGLAIVKHLARAQGGEAGVNSEMNRGSTFYFTLPVYDLGLTEYGAVQPELTAQ